MNPSPAEQWLRVQSHRFNGRLPDRPLPVTWLSDPRVCPRSPFNWVARPDFAAFPVWFDVKQTSQGQELARVLGPHSGYFQEYAAWAPWAAWGFDLTAAFVDLVAHPDLPPNIRDLLLPYVYGYVQLAEAESNQLRLHHVHAEHKGTGLEGSWRAIQANLRLTGGSQGFQTDAVDGLLLRMRTELLNQEVKLATKTAAARRSTSGPPASGTSPPPHPSTKRGRSRGSKPPPQVET